MPATSTWHSFTHSFRFRLFLIFTIGTTLITAALTTTYLVREEQEYRRQARERARLLAQALAASVRIPLFSNDRREIDNQAADVARQQDVALVRVSTTTGAILAELRPSTAPAGTISESQIVSIRTESDAENLALSGQSPPAPLGRVLVELDTARLQESIRRMTLTTSIYAAVFWLVVIIVSYLALGRFTASYQRLLDGLGRMRDGNLEIDIPVVGSDEPARAARAVNDMARSLRQREEENRELQEQLLENMRFKLEETQKMNMAKMIQTNRMTSLGLLVSSMAHEINNPNGAIRLEGNFLGKVLNEMTGLITELNQEGRELLISGMEFSELCQELRRAHQNLLNNTTRIETVINDLRAYSLGGNAPYCRNVDINRVVISALTIIRSLGRYANARLEEDFREDLPIISGSHHQLEQVVVNLLLNALQSLPLQGGTVRIATGLTPDCSQILISVSDTGEGIPGENLARLYEPFFSTRIESGGSGLGLYISNFIISEHHGTLEFASQVGSGTTVNVRLPFAPQ